MEYYPSLNQETKKTFWFLIEKYDTIYPDFCTALNESIQNKITDEHLKTIMKYEFSFVLDEDDRLKLYNDMCWYYSYLESLHSYDDWQEDWQEQYDDLCNGLFGLRC